MTYRSERADQARTKNARGMLKWVKKCAQKSQKNVVVERARGSSKSIKCARKVETCQKMRAKISENCPAKPREEKKMHELRNLTAVLANVISSVDLAMVGKRNK